VAGSAGDVVRGQRRGLVGGLAARVVAAGYDGIGRLVAIGGARTVVGHGIVDGRGVVTSLVEADEIRDAPGAWPRESGRLALAWAGRLAAGKGLETVIETVASFRPAAGVADLHLAILGDGPDRERLETLARSLGVANRVRWLGYVADRASYLDELAAADAFVFPSPAEGFPKVVLDAMAVGLPVVASPSGTVGELAARGLVEAVRPGSPASLAAAVRRLAGDPDRVADLRQRGAAFASRHTRSAEAARLVDSWRVAFPGLPWA
jgi:glycosyltransferase involved in cell wall biosynthesis